MHRRLVSKCSYFIISIMLQYIFYLCVCKPLSLFFSLSISLSFSLSLCSFCLRFILTASYSSFSPLSATESLKSYFLLCLVTVIFFVTIYILLCSVTEFPPDTWAFPMTRAYELLNSRGEVEDWYPLSSDWLDGSLVISLWWIGMRVVFPLVP